MSLTVEDLSQIRTVIREEVREIVHDEVQTEIQKEVRPLARKIDDLAGKIEALENDVKEIYTMLSRLEKLFFPDKEFQRLSVERRLLKLNQDLLATAKQAGVTLPR